MEKVSVPIKGMHCASCALTIEKALKRVDGVQDCQVNYGTEKAKIEYDSQKVNLNDLSEKIKPFGYSLNTSAVHVNNSKPSTVVSATKVSDGMREAQQVVFRDEGTSDQSKSLEQSHIHVMTNSTNFISTNEVVYENQLPEREIDNSKQEKLQELAEQKEKVDFVLPLTFAIFILMLWEIAAASWKWFPKFFFNHELYSILLLVIATPVMFWIGRPFIDGVGKFIKHRYANMDTLIGLGTLTAYIYSAVLVLMPNVRDLLGLPTALYFDVTIVVIGFITLGKYLEARSKLKTGEAIEKLLNLQAKSAWVIRDGQEVEIPIDQVQLGEIVIVKSGTKVPVDGEIVEGKSSVDESMVTGEPMPVDKKAGDKVIGGTINKQGTFKFKATGVGSDTMLAQIIGMVEEAQGSRAPIQKLADQISGIFVPIVLVIAILTFLAWITIGSQFMPASEALSIGLLCFVGILVIACPCALGLATPTAIIVGVGKGAENGVLIKNAESLQKLHKVNTIVVDKTGTVTKGKPEVTDIVMVGSVTDDNRILQILASIEKYSEHPLASAIMEKANSIGINIQNVEDFEVVEGKGLTGKLGSEEYFIGNMKYMRDLNLSIDPAKIEVLTKQGKTPVILASKQEILAIVAIADTIKDTAIEAIKSLHKLKIKVVMLTGDDRNTAEYIAKQVGIDQVFAEVLPQEKAAKVKELQAEGRIVAMAGDGVNDAPALAQSDVGIAMGTGTDVAIESADITLLAGDISKIAKAIKLSKMTMRTIKQNLFWAFIYNVIGIPLAAGLFYPFAGILLNPIFAGLAMAFSSVSVVTNSLRLKVARV